MFPNDVPSGAVQCDKRIAGFSGRFRVVTAVPTPNPKTRGTAVAPAKLAVSKLPAAACQCLLNQGILGFGKWKCQRLSPGRIGHFFPGLL